MESFKPTLILIHGAGPGHYRSLKDGTGDWQAKLPEVFGKQFKIIAPQMPSPKNPSYEEWKILLEKYLLRVKGEIHFVGHSLGGSFLIRYLAEKNLEQKVAGLYIVAAPINTFPGFEAPESYFPFSKIKNIFLYHSLDDVEVPFAHALINQERLQGELRTFSDRGHYFKKEKFKEIIDDIHSTLTVLRPHQELP